MVAGCREPPKANSSAPTALYFSWPHVSFHRESIRIEKNPASIYQVVSRYLREKGVGQGAASAFARSRQHARHRQLDILDARPVTVVHGKESIQLVGVQCKFVAGQYGKNPARWDKNTSSLLANKGNGA
jgi:hypothetical protein